MHSDDHEKDGASLDEDRELELRLRALRVDVAPPAGAEVAVVRELRLRGMLPGGAQRRWSARWPSALPMPVAAGVVLLLAAGTFGGGFAAGRSSAGGAGPAASTGTGTGPGTGTGTGTGAGTGAPRFLLLLYEDAAFDRAPAAEQAQRAHEYGEWARGLGPTARFVDGEELAEVGRLLDPGGAARAWESGVGLPPPGAIGGYFVVEALDLDAAEVVARGCPHLAYGGHVEVRPVLRRDTAH